VMIRIFFAILLLGAPLLMPTPSVAAQRTFTVVNDTDDAVWLNIEYDGPFSSYDNLCAQIHIRGIPQRSKCRFQACRRPGGTTP